MNLNERNFSGELFRPTPEIHFESDGSLTIVATPWGPRSASKKLVQSIVDFFHSTRNDLEITSPFQRLTCLSTIGNNLRTAVMLANDIVFREENKEEYLTGFELFAAAIFGTEFAWISIGQPHVLLLRNQNIYPLSSALESTLDQLHINGKISPLPQNLLGLYSTSNFEVRTLKLMPEDKIILLSRTLLGPMAAPQKDDSFDLEKMSQRLAKDNSRMPFWLGIIDRSA